MKKYTILLILLILHLGAFGQDSLKVSNKEKDSLVYNFGDVEISLEKEIKCKRKKDSPKECARKAVIRHFNLTFNTEVISKLGLLSGTYIINNSISVDERGNLLAYDAESDLEGLEKEALRVLATLPKIFQGSFNGKPIVVKLDFPATLRVQ
ncbi:hypothetical protein [Aquimarina pacifica]|uniref:hypothetical protein n=1 Tax=Aquimarina pacifica TaxID=1296415 RepID=UPI000472CBA2|nr:hypothetical protein [Aquimarina pacifica]